MAKRTSTEDLPIRNMPVREELSTLPAMSLTLRIRELRQARGYTLAELADIVGISTPHMSGVERGVKNLNNHLIERISDALKVQPYELLISPGNETVGFLLAFQALSPEDQRRVIAFAEALGASGTETQQG